MLNSGSILKSMLHHGKILCWNQDFVPFPGFVHISVSDDFRFVRRQTDLFITNEKFKCSHRRNYIQDFQWFNSVIVKLPMKI